MARTSLRSTAPEKVKAAGGGAQGGSRLRSRKVAEDLEHLNARIPSELMTQLRVHCAMNRMSIQNLVSEALERMLAGSK
jgi:hypothetical protein